MRLVKKVIAGFLVLATAGAAYGSILFSLLFAAVGSAHGGILFSEDFESYNVLAPIIGQDGWTAVNATGSQTNSIGGISSYFSGGGRSLYIYDSNTTPTLANQRISNIFDTQNHAMLFSFDFNVRTNGQNPSLFLYSGATPAVQVNLMNGDGTMKYNDGSGLVAVSSYVLSTSYWYRVAIAVHGMSSSSDTFDIKVWEGQGSTTNGVLVIDKTGLGFMSGVAFLDTFTFGTGGALGQSGSKFNIDNIQIESIPEPAWKSYYVKVDGSESASGVNWANATTLTGARDKIRNLTGTWYGDVEVVLASGFYCMDSILVFNESDSGKDGYKVIYRNDEGCFPAISRSKQIVTGWNVGPSYWWSVATVTNLFRDLSTGINGPGTPAVLARSDMVTRGAALIKTNTSSSISNTIRVAKSTLVTQATNALAAGYPVEIKLYHKWAHTIARIESAYESGGYVYLKPRTSERNRMFNNNPSGTFTADYYGVWYQNQNILYSYRFQNSPTFIDQEGEFWKGSQYIYYKHRTGETTDNLVVAVPLGDRVMEVKGTTLTSRAHDIVFRGINFSENTWNETTSYGFLGTQAVGHYDRNGNRAKIPLAVLVENADRIDFVRCRFYRLATTALGFYKSVTSSDIEGCYFRDVGGAAVEIYGAASTFDTNQFNQATEYVQDCRIVNNYMKNSGSVYEMTPALVGVMGPGHLITHNEIDGGPYSGISWGWGLNRADYANAPLWDNEIKANYIHDMFEYVQDGAGIYTYGNHQDDLWIFENYLKDIVRSPYAESIQPICGLYFDSGTYDVIAQRNVMENIDTNWPSVFFHNYGTSTTFPDGTPIPSFPITAAQAAQYYNTVSTNNDIQDQAVKDRAGIQPEWIGAKNWVAAPLPTILNVALNRKVSASSTTSSTNGSYLPDRGVDNDTNTIWASGSEGSGAKPEYCIEFNRPIRFRQVELVARQGWDQPVARRNFVIEGSTNGIVWVQLASQGSTAFPSESTWVGSVTNATAYSYVRLRKTVSEAMNFAELRLLTQ
ncbi:MAG: discoidin domain-containing protein [Kiritimatiellaceae bacterium]|nr:discoidin domain-containing protein [Kiritimatiellaceae bacterium]